MPLPTRRHRSSRLARLIASLSATSAAIALAGSAQTACAQGWDPFSQLETNRWEQRSPRDRQRTDETARPPQAYPAPAAAPPDSADAAARGAYLDPPDRRPRFGDQPQTYYPPPRTDLPASGARPPAVAMPATIEAEPLAPLPGADLPAPAASPGPGIDAAYGGPAGGYTGNPGVPQPPGDRYPARGGAGRSSQQPLDLAVRHALPGSGLADHGPGLPAQLWRGLDLPAIERLMASLEIPPRSPALHDLWHRLVTADREAPAGGADDGRFLALRLEALYRSGLIAETQKALSAAPPGSTDDPLVAMLTARAQIGLGQREAGCETVKRMQNIRGEIPKSLRAEAILVSGYCAAASGNKPAAGLLAELAREEGLKPSPGLAALDAVALGVRADLSLPKGQQLSLIDYRILELGGAAPPAGDLIPVASPALLAAVASDPAAGDDLRLAAAEAAAKINALPPTALAALYRRASGKMSRTEAPVQSTANGSDTPQRRAHLYAAAEAERTPFKKVRMIRAFIDSAKRADLYLAALAMAAPLTDDIGLVPEIGWFAETAIEVNLAAANYGRARMWAKFAASVDSGRDQNIDHWMALIDIADPDFPGRRGDSLAVLERLALMGRFCSENLHRLATVLDALEYNVPIPLWEAASRTPQPTAGHLPPTGVLSELQDAAKKREFGRTVLLTMQTLGPDGADGAHMIALGDAIRALKRAGLEPDARRLGFEALLPGWPRVVTN